MTQDQMFMMWFGGMMATMFISFIVQADGKVMKGSTKFFMYMSVVFWPVLLPFTAVVMLCSRKKGPKNDRTIH